MSGSSVRTVETMLAELVHHMAEMTKVQSETNRLLKDMLAALAKR